MRIFSFFFFSSFSFLNYEPNPGLMLRYIIFQRRWRKRLFLFLSARKFVFMKKKKRKLMLLEKPAVLHLLNVTRLSFSPSAERRTRKEQNSSSIRKTVKETRQGKFYRPMKSFGAPFMYSFVPEVSFSFFSFLSWILVPFWWHRDREETLTLAFVHFLSHALSFCILFSSMFSHESWSVSI